jgi:hypothetical protein
MNIGQVWNIYDGLSNMKFGPIDFNASTDAYNFYGVMHKYTWAGIAQSL